MTALTPLSVALSVAWLVLMIALAVLMVAASGDQ